MVEALMVIVGAAASAAETPLNWAAIAAAPARAATAARRHDLTI
jgi:hypothetical protein